MGAPLSKLWGSLRSAWAGGGRPRARPNTNRDVEYGLSTTNTPVKPPTSLPAMGAITKYEITEVCAT